MAELLLTHRALERSTLPGRAARLAITAPGLLWIGTAREKNIGMGRLEKRVGPIYHKNLMHCKGEGKIVFALPS